MTVSGTSGRWRGCRIPSHASAVSGVTSSQLAVCCGSACVASASMSLPCALFFLCLLPLRGCFPVFQVLKRVKCLGDDQPGLRESLMLAQHPDERPDFMPVSDAERPAAWQAVTAPGGERHPVPAMEGDVVDGGLDLSRRSGPYSRLRPPAEMTVTRHPVHRVRLTPGRGL